MRETVTLVVKLFLISAIAGLLLGVVNDITYEPIQKQAEMMSNEAKSSVCENAKEFVQLNNASETDKAPVEIEGIVFEDVDDSVDDVIITVAICEKGISGVIGQITVKGYGGEIEVTIGMDLEGKILGLTVGGPNFKETEGYGSKAKDVAFTEQFIGKTYELILKKANEATTSENNVDAITGATTTSKTVVDAANLLCQHLLVQVDFINENQGGN